MRMTAQHVAMTALTIGLATALALAAAACDGDGGGDADGGATPGAKGAFVPTPDPVGYPITLTDMLGRQVTIEAAPQRIAAISPAAVEYVYAAGGASVTRPSDSDAPPEAQSAADIGPSDAPDIDKIGDADPDLIIADSGTQEDLLAEFEATGVPVVFVGAPSFSGVLDGLALVGKAIDKQAEAEQAVASLRNQIIVIGTRLPGQQPTVLVLSGPSGDLRAALASSYAGDFLRLLGAVNVATLAPNPDGDAYRPITLDEIARLAPEVIVVLRGADELGQAEDLARAAELASVPAVATGRVHTLLDAPGPRAGETLDVLSKMLYPSIFGP